MSDSELKLDPVAEAILGALEGGNMVAPDIIAKQIAETRAKPGDRPDLWRRYLPAVKQQAVFLARQGAIEILRKGKPRRPERLQGVGEIEAEDLIRPGDHQQPQLRQMGGQ